jgi:hypothetical protein
LVIRRHFPPCEVTPRGRYCGKRECPCARIQLTRAPWLRHTLDEVTDKGGAGKSALQRRPGHGFDRLDAGKWREALKDHLATDEAAAATLREMRRRAYPAFLLYSLLAVMALWFPNVSAAITTVTWLFWLVLSIRLKHA